LGVDGLEKNVGLAAKDAETRHIDAFSMIPGLLGNLAFETDCRGAIPDVDRSLVSQVPVNSWYFSMDQESSRHVGQSAVYTFAEVVLLGAVGGRGLVLRSRGGSRSGEAPVDELGAVVGDEPPDWTRVLVDGVGLVVNVASV
jgi:hypothetical protein